MDILDNFWIDENNYIRLNKHIIVVRVYKTVEKTNYSESTYYLNDDSYKEWTEQLIPKHQLNELISDESLDASEYAWMDGIQLKDPVDQKEILKIVSYGSREAYEASLEEVRDEYLLDLDSRLASLELGI